MPARASIQAIQFEKKLPEKTPTQPKTQEGNPNEN